MAPPTELHERMKRLEAQTCDMHLMPGLPVIARMDGKNFSRFTRDLKRPYEKKLSDLMIETTKYLVEKTCAVVGYTQSDEITLMWPEPVYFEGRFFKMVGDLAAMTSVYFNCRLPEFLPEKVKELPRFDARVFSAPNLEEAAEVFLWRQHDATRNALSMAAQAYYPASELQSKNASQKHELLFQKGVNFNDFPSFFKRGTFVKRTKTFSKFTTEEIDLLPPLHNARTNPDMVVERTLIYCLDPCPILKKEDDIKSILFF